MAAEQNHCPRNFDLAAHFPPIKHRLLDYTFAGRMLASIESSHLRHPSNTDFDSSSCHFPTLACCEISLLPVKFLMFLVPRCGKSARSSRAYTWCFRGRSLTYARPSPFELIGAQFHRTSSIYTET